MLRRNGRVVKSVYAQIILDRSNEIWLKSVQKWQTEKIKFSTVFDARCICVRAALRRIMSVHGVIVALLSRHWSPLYTRWWGSYYSREQMVQRWCGNCTPDTSFYIAARSIRFASSNVAVKILLNALELHMRVKQDFAPIAPNLNVLSKCRAQDFFFIFHLTSWINFRSPGSGVADELGLNPAPSSVLSAFL